MTALHAIEDIALGIQIELGKQRGKKIEDIALGI
jgi:hypothetical protein